MAVFEAGRGRTTPGHAGSCDLCSQPSGGEYQPLLWLQWRRVGHSIIRYARGNASVVHRSQAGDKAYANQMEKSTIDCPVMHDL
jgi:hypothetical protein